MPRKWISDDVLRHLLHITALQSKISVVNSQSLKISNADVGTLEIGEYTRGIVLPLNVNGGTHSSQWY